MGQGYTRQSSAEIQTGEEILASPLNAEFNAIESAFDGTGGHSHDGTLGEGPKIDLENSVTGILQINNGGVGGIHKLDATTAPTATDDTSLGYVVGSLWVDTTSDQWYICVDNSTGAAVWVGKDSLDPDLAAIAALSSTGFAVRTAANTWAQRSIAGTSPVSVTNGNGVSGNPTIAVAAVTTGTDGLMIAADKVKLNGIATGATANSSDATLLARANHTGTQAISTVSGLQAALDSKQDIGGGGAVDLATDVTGVLPVANGGTGSNTASGARTNLGLGSLATLSSVNNGNWSGTDLAVANGGTGASDASGARTNLGLGSLATQDKPNVSSVDGTLPIANGGTGATAAATALSNLGGVPTARTVTAGNGMSGGGALSGNITLTMGTPSSLSSSTTNAVTATSHTHAITAIGANIITGTLGIANGGSGQTTEAGLRGAYTGTSAANTAFPIGAYVVVIASSGTSYPRNSTVPVKHENTSNGTGYADNSTVTVPGTWRSRGIIFGYSNSSYQVQYLVQRVA